MPGVGAAIQRDWTEAELAMLAVEGATLISEAHPDGLELDAVLRLLGYQAVDVHLNDQACWRAVPLKVWNYNLSGYQVLKKWLSYREQAVLGRPLRPDEALYVGEMVRRIAAVLLLRPELDLAYASAKADAVPWREGRPAPSVATQ